jgi:predicted NAD/FAD-binding protein
MPANNQKESIAIVGGGVAGIVSAYLLQSKYQVTLFEQNKYLGGHTNTVEINHGDDAGIAVDTGFIVLNDKTYPLFEKFLSRLGVPTRDSEMSFGFHCQTSGLVYAGNNLNGLFAQRRNIFNPKFYRFLFEIDRFNKNARKALTSHSVPDITLGEYLKLGHYSAYMVDNYLLPMAAAIWSTPTLQAADFPAQAFLNFFKNHGLLSFSDRPQWKTVVGGSYSYVKAFTAQFKGEIRLDAGVKKVARVEDGIELIFADNSRQKFDKAVLATHADQALNLLDQPTDDEYRLLSPWQYQKNYTVLHTDSSILPAQRSAWSAWNFTRATKESDSQPVFVTYYMNLLQGLTAKKHYCVTLNRHQDFQPGSVIAEFDYQHPQYTFSSLSTQAKLPQLNGQSNIWYCGSYFGYGFHEDAVRSAVAVGSELGVVL